MMKNEIDVTEYKYLLVLAQSISDSIKGKSSDQANVIASDFLTKAIQSCLSIWSLVIDYPINIFGRKIYDYPSALTLLRTVIEGYVNFSYLLNDTCEIGERKLRILIFLRHSIHERIKMLGFISEKNDDLIELEQKVSALTMEISKNSIYQRSTPSEQQSLRDTEQWYRTGYKIFDNKAEIAGMTSETKKAIYKFLSNYVHTFPLSLEQINTAFNEKEIHGILKLIIDNTSIFLALTLDLFSKINSEAMEMVEKEEYFQTLVAEYKKIISTDLKTVM